MRIRETVAAVRKVEANFPAVFLKEMHEKKLNSVNLFLTLELLKTYPQFVVTRKRFFLNKESGI